MKIGFYTLTQDNFKYRSKRDNHTRIYKINVPEARQKGWGFLLNLKLFALGVYKLA